MFIPNYLKSIFKLIIILWVSLLITFSVTFADEVVKIGLNYPKTGPYSVQGLDQWRATLLAVEEINAAGGILGKKIQIVWRDSQSKVDVTEKNVTELIEMENVNMVFGGSASSVAIAAGEICRQKGVLFFGTLTYSTATTGIQAHRYQFRECYNAWMGAKALSSYLKTLYPAEDNKYFYITADYTWGHTTESSMRLFSRSGNTTIHKGIRTPFPNATDEDFRKAIAFAKIIKPDVLVLVLFGKDMANAIRIATAEGLKKDMQIVVPNITLGMAESGGPKVMEGIIGALPWTWRVPYKYNYPKGIEFIENFSNKYNRYPSTASASAYTILYQYKDAVERAKTFETTAVIKQLEGYKFTSLKDEQLWRAFDHQNIQTVYAVKCKPEHEVLKDKYKLDYFEIIGIMPGEEAARTRIEWNAVRVSAGKSTVLKSFPGE